ncbi:AraC family transcriptional regulator [Vallitalea pronyensis]|uniref:AraC family transcriptional regulator n=1 Tax=Vallitalea pronyensis TaxID=1348613 RepID=A0A8J8MHF9_9FIRM|nr:helix-turn-helix domain-containing protein [Vallitalea pronyensis]QUI21887.1 AraC family transcriptional regulator [Vallitalea pronyensis]
MTNKRIYFNNIIRYIEAHLYSPITTQQISQVGFISLMQLYRDFYAYTGHSVKEYIRKRRLSNALALVKSSKMTLADIAYYCGYSSQQAFHKQVRSTTGQTPLQYKKSDHYYYYPPFKGPFKTYINVAKERIPATIYLKFYDSQLKGIENRAIEHLFMLLPDFHGRLFGRNGTQSSHKFTYELYLELNDDTQHLVNLNASYGDLICYGNTYHHPVHTYATTTVNNHEEAIHQAWDYLYTDWLQSSMFQQAHENFFEEYIIKHGKPIKLKLYLPVKKKSNPYEITIKHAHQMTFLTAQQEGIYAEKKASKQIAHYFGIYYPDILETAQNFIVSKHKDRYLCGIQIDKHQIHFPLPTYIQTLTLAEGYYAILKGDSCVNSSIYEQRLISWLNDNGLSTHSRTPFTLYHSSCSKNKYVSMSIYCPLNMLKTDNTVV